LPAPWSPWDRGYQIEAWALPKVLHFFAHFSDERLLEQFDVLVWIEEQCGVAHVTHVNHFYGAPK
jgi:hypothetical protein